MKAPKNRVQTLAPTPLPLLARVGCHRCGMLTWHDALLYGARLWLAVPIDCPSCLTGPLAAEKAVRHA